MSFSLLPRRALVYLGDSVDRRSHCVWGRALLHLVSPFAGTGGSVRSGHVNCVAFPSVRTLHSTFAALRLCDFALKLTRFGTSISFADVTLQTMNDRQPTIFVVGSFVVGLTIRVPRMPVLGEALVGDEFDMGPGGKGTNQSVAAARLGAHVGLLACIGEDIFSTVADDLFAAEGIDCRHIHRIAGINTAVGFVHLIPSGENWIVGHLGANLQMQPEHVDAVEEQIASSDILLTQYEVPPAVVRRALELGRKHGRTTVWNPAPAQAVTQELLQFVDVLTPNQTELRILLDLPPDDPTSNEELARRLLEMGAGSVIATLGQQGAIIATNDGIESVPAVSGISVVDVTGAGDSFNAALAVALGNGLSLRAAVVQATYAGAFAVQHLGVINGLPTRAQLEQFQQAQSA